MNYCFTFLSCGERYNNTLHNRLKNNPIFKGKNILVTTDAPDMFSEFGKAFKVLGQTSLTPVKSRRRRRSWFNFNLKHEAIENAANLGYNKIFYVDADIEMFEWKEDFFIKEKKGAFFRRLIKRSQHADKYNFYDKIFRLSLWRMYRPVSEKIMYFNESTEKIKMFTETWKHLDLLSRNKINPPTEGHEVRISCRANDIEVHTYKPDPFKTAGGGIFKDKMLL